MKNYDTIRHVKGESQFVDDILVPEGLLYAAVSSSEVAHGEIINIDISEALKVEGVKIILTAKDIPGENQIGGIIPDEELFASDKVD
ncbi:MAG: xanthine dehydrogenase, partial [Ignavibacteria bacterium]|nr:xanthine dehydrogenase [Ignavibacteria bacterium]